MLHSAYKMPKTPAWGDQGGAYSRPCTQLAEPQLLAASLPDSTPEKAHHGGSSPGDAQEPAYTLFEKEPLPQPAMWFPLLSLGPPRNALCSLNLYLLILNLAWLDWLHWQRVLILVYRNFSLWWLDMPPPHGPYPPGWKTDTVYCLIHLHLQSFQ